MEACAGSQWLARKLIALGHDARIIPAKFVKAYVKSNKSDTIDAEAIAEVGVAAGIAASPIVVAGVGIAAIVAVGFGINRLIATTGVKTAAQDFFKNTDWYKSGLTDEEIYDGAMIAP